MKNTQSKTAAIMRDIDGYDRAASEAYGVAPAGDLVEQAIQSTAIQAANALHARRVGCGHALKAGLGLIWLHRETAAPGARNDNLVPRGTRLGFEQAVERVGIPKRTAYRWMNAAGAACQRAKLARDAEELLEELPPPGCRQWEMWEEALEQVAEGMSLNRLMLGQVKDGTEDHRYNELVSGAEEGRERAEVLLAAVAEGKYTLAQAVKALGSQEAYDRLRQEGGEKVRRDPVYLDLDAETGELCGLMPKSLVTIRNAFHHWEELPAPARRKVRELWLEVVVMMPRELVER
jgi:hypothetical protein